jgi:hypothetical protein
MGKKVVGERGSRQEFPGTKSEALDHDRLMTTNQHVRGISLHFSWRGKSRQLTRTSRVGWAGGQSGAEREAWALTLKRGAPPSFPDHGGLKLAPRINPNF